MSSSSCGASLNIQVVSAELEKSEADAAKFLDKNMGKEREQQGHQDGCWDFDTHSDRKGIPAEVLIWEIDDDEILIWKDPGW